MANKSVKLICEKLSQAKGRKAELEKPSACKYPEWEEVKQG